MVLKETIHEMHQYLEALGKDLTKTSKGNKAACQRVRIGTIQLGKIAKRFRKESIAAEKMGALKKHENFFLK